MKAGSTRGALRRDDPARTDTRGMWSRALGHTFKPWSRCQRHSWLLKALWWTASARGGDEGPITTVKRGATRVKAPIEILTRVCWYQVPRSAPAAPAAIGPGARFP